MSKPSRLTCPKTLSTNTTFFVFNPSNVHIVTMSEHLIVTTLLIKSKIVALYAGVVNVDPVVTTMVSPAAALLYADCSADVATVTVAAETMGTKHSSWIRMSHTGRVGRRFEGAGWGAGCMGRREGGGMKGRGRGESGFWVRGAGVRSM
jgi:hypothetical protein